MALFDFTLTTADMGRVLPVADGFVVKLRQTQSGVYDQPAFDEGRQQWTNGRFVLRATGEFRNFVCIDAQGVGGWASHYGTIASVLDGASVAYHGEMQIICVPKLSIWEITLSDQPYVRTVERNWLDSAAKRVNDMRELVAVTR